MMKYGTYDNEEFERKFNVQSQSSFFPKSKQFIRTAIIFLSVCSISALSILLLSSTSVYPKSQSEVLFASSSTEMSTTGNADIDDMSFSRVGYRLLDYFNTSSKSKIKYPLLHNYMGIIEPSAKMVLRSYNTSVERGTGFTYKHEICEIRNDIETSNCILRDITDSFVYNCYPYDKFSITINKYNGKNGALVGSRSGQAICLYVRREIRSLTREDQDDYITALKTLWKYNDADGQSKFGDKYKSSLFIQKIHYFQAAFRDADHLHFGNGFLLGHIKLDTYMEGSLRSVNPAVNIPYWDFTIEQSLGISIADSFVFNSSLYGKIKKPNNISEGYLYAYDNLMDGAISDGSFEKLKSPVNTFYESMKWGYGYLRAPWNMNPSPYVSRFPYEFPFFSLPTCAEHYSMLSYENMMEFYTNMSISPHGSTHIGIGGTFGCDLLYPLVNSGHILSMYDAKVVCSSWSNLMTSTYRSNYWSPKKNCTVNKDNLEDSVCGFDCNKENLDDIISYVEELLGEYLNTSKSDFSTVWIDFICYGNGYKIYPGDHTDASIAVDDPSFWGIHPALERLYQAKLLSGGFSDEVWASDPINEYICATSDCVNNKGVEGYWSTCCDGHYSYSRFCDAISGNRYEYIGQSNEEIFKISDPRSKNYTLPYIYDNFKWNHCSENFEEKLNTLFKSKYYDVGMN
eukprot:gene9550-12862_t